MPRMRGGLLLALALLAGTGAPAAELTLELKAFNGADDVTQQTRMMIHRAGDRTEPVARLGGGARVLSVALPAGIYDVQAIREREGRVVTIRWALRLVVMPYPDEQGRHLEVINFQNGYGALEVRRRDHGPPDVTVYRSGDHAKPAVQPVAGAGYALFVLPAGAYDIASRQAGAVSWETTFDVPLDRTRLLVVP
jgi:hypothetical protein